MVSLRTHTGDRSNNLIVSAVKPAFGSRLRNGRKTWIVAKNYKGGTTGGAALGWTNQIEFVPTGRLWFQIADIVAFIDDVAIVAAYLVLRVRLVGRKADGLALIEDSVSFRGVSTDYGSRSEVEKVCTGWSRENK